MQTALVRKRRMQRDFSGAGGETFASESMIFA